MSDHERSVTVLLDECVARRQLTRSVANLQAHECQYDETPPELVLSATILLATMGLSPNEVMALNEGLYEESMAKARARQAVAARRQ